MKPIAKSWNIFRTPFHLSFFSSDVFSMAIFRDSRSRVKAFSKTKSPVIEYSSKAISVSCIRRLIYSAKPVGKSSLTSPKIFLARSIKSAIVSLWGSVNCKEDSFMRPLRTFRPRRSPDCNFSRVFDPLTTDQSNSYPPKGLSADCLMRDMQSSKSVVSSPSSFNESTKSFTSCTASTISANRYPDASAVVAHSFSKKPNKYSAAFIVSYPSLKAVPDIRLCTPS